MIDQTDIGAQLSHAMLRDPRRTRRAQQIVRSLAEDPAQPFPAIFDPAALEGFYRFAGNPSTEAGELIRSHAQEVMSRVDVGRRVIVSHDTTTFEFKDGIERTGLGYIKRYKKNAKKWKPKEDVRGFFGHFSLAVGVEDEQYKPLAALSLIPINRLKPRALHKSKPSGAECAQLKDPEAKRWLDGVKRSMERLPEPGEAIHVMDREGDKYWLLDELAKMSARFVVRVNHNRRLLSDEQTLLRDKLDTALPLKLERRVPINARKAKPFARDNKKHPPREARIAHLEIRAFPLRLRAPNYYPDKEGFPTHVVWVYEPNPPEGGESVEWLLYTNEPIDTDEQVAAIVDAYRARWLIEELFKAIKTGCQFEKRRLESYEALLVTLALFTPVAVRLLALRHIARATPDAPATNVVSTRQLKLITILCPKRNIGSTSTARDVLLAVASLGGHLRHNGWPGWLVLRRGLEKLLQAEEVYEAILANM